MRLAMWKVGERSQKEMLDLHGNNENNSDKNSSQSTSGYSGKLTVVDSELSNKKKESQLEGRAHTNLGPYPFIVIESKPTNFTY